MQNVTDIILLYRNWYDMTSIKLLHVRLLQTFSFSITEHLYMRQQKPFIALFWVKLSSKMYHGLLVLRFDQTGLTSVNCGVLWWHPTVTLRRCRGYYHCFTYPCLSYCHLWWHWTSVNIQLVWVLCNTMWRLDWTGWNYSSVPFHRSIKFYDCWDQKKCQFNGQNEWIQREPFRWVIYPHNYKKTINY